MIHQSSSLLYTIIIVFVLFPFTLSSIRFLFLFSLTDLLIFRKVVDKSEVKEKEGLKYLRGERGKLEITLGKLIQGETCIYEKRLHMIT